VKPKVLVCVLTGLERTNWINPELSINLIRMLKDTRFEVNYYPVKDCRPVESARNMSIVAARQIDADWLVSFDNDNFVPGPGNPLDIITEAGNEQHVIGLPYAVGNTEGYRMVPDEKQGGQVNGLFQEQDIIAGGVLLVRKNVWQTIKTGPWFRWQHADTESLMPAPGVCGEDIYFCRLVRRHGLRVWTHTRRYAGHYRTTDITGMVCTMAQMGAK
jgi:hypothetical protein